jgi:hypothetical protein
MDNKIILIKDKMVLMDNNIQLMDLKIMEMVLINTIKINQINHQMM